jgi:hypothetical protein
LWEKQILALSWHSAEEKHVRETYAGPVLAFYWKEVCERNRYWPYPGILLKRSM